MKKDIQKQQIHIEEYQAWVRENKRIPKTTERIKFSTGTIMSLWRHNYFGLVKKFEEEMKPVFEEFEKAEKDQKFFEKEYLSHFNAPKTLVEYLERDNRYIYGDFNVFKKIMEYIGESPAVTPYINLIIAMYGERYSWKLFHRTFNINTLPDQINAALESRLNDYQRQIIRYRYGLDGNGGKSLQETGDLLGINRERVRQREEKALRLLRHPRTLSMLKREVSVTNVTCGHWFMVYTGTGRYSKLIGVVRRPIHELEEVLDYLNCNWAADDPEYDIVSVKTFNTYSFDIPEDGFEEMDIPKEMLLRDVIYQYTIIRLKEAPHRPSFEESLEEALEEMRIKAKEERERLEAIDRPRQEFLKWYGDRMKTRINFVWVFNYEISELLYHRHLDDNYKWVDWFNRGIQHILVPVEYYTDATELLKNQLCRRLKNLHITCLYTEYNDEYYTLQLRK